MCDMPFRSLFGFMCCSSASMGWKLQLHVPLLGSYVLSEYPFMAQAVAGEHGRPSTIL
jgi:hypothetical protein